MAEPEPRVGAALALTRLEIEEGGTKGTWMEISFHNVYRHAHTEVSVYS